MTITRKTGKYFIHSNRITRLFKELINLNVNTDAIINVKFPELNTKIVVAFLSTQNLKRI